MAAEEQGKVPVKGEEGRGGQSANPWEPLERLRGEMDRLFDDFTSAWPWGHARRRRHGMMEPWRGMTDPWRGMAFGVGAGLGAVDVVDKDKEIQIRAELPGMEEKDIDVRVSDGMLTIQGEKKEEKEEGEAEGRYYLSERRYGSFQRSFQLPDGVDLDSIEAKFKNGVLTISLPRTKEAQEKSKKIEVRSGT